MEKPVKGNIVVLSFPFSDLSSTKKRPALVLASLQGDDVILCQITSEARVDDYSIILLNSDFKQGGLKQTSMIRPNRLFTADKSLIEYKAGTIKEGKMKEAEQALLAIFTSKN
ncbi:type II toxin-antitoxin system PemK/MazF family toxin [Candidatus Woesearchaeota archaeon]|nr:type II toxin-antitoxin system PemK/MazF family toxin [Candidatus Woesearchaeota archaeon]